MRKFLITLLLAGAVATPALARPNGDSGRNALRAERQQARSERAVQPERPQFNGGNRFNPPANGGGQQPFVFRQRVESNDGSDRRNFEGHQAANGSAPDTVRNWPGPRRERATEQNQPNEQVMPDRRERFGDRDRFDNSGALRRGDRPLPPVMRTRVPVVSTVPQPGTMPPPRVDNHRRGDVRWSTDWRRDNRYDWRGWRDRHRDRFRIGVYYDPFGWGYQPYSIGWRMWPSYYGSNFWINDPSYYRLPYAPPGTQWVRYFNDAILVDMYTGQVVDVIYNFFW